MLREVTIAATTIQHRTPQPTLPGQWHWTLAPPTTGTTRAVAPGTRCHRSACSCHQNGFCTSPALHYESFFEAWGRSIRFRFTKLSICFLLELQAGLGKQGAEIFFVFLHFSIVTGICFSPVIIRLPQTKKSGSDAREPPNGVCSPCSQVHSTNKLYICLGQVLFGALGMQK